MVLLFFIMINLIMPVNIGLSSPEGGGTGPTVPALPACYPDQATQIYDRALGRCRDISEVPGFEHCPTGMVYDSSTGRCESTRGAGPIVEAYRPPQPDLAAEPAPDPCAVLPLANPDDCPTSTQPTEPGSSNEGPNAMPQDEGGVQTPVFEIDAGEQDQAPDNGDDNTQSEEVPLKEEEGDQVGLSWADQASGGGDEERPDPQIESTQSGDVAGELSSIPSGARSTSNQTANTTTSQMPSPSTVTN